MHSNVVLWREVVESGEDQSDGSQTASGPVRLRPLWPGPENSPVVSCCQHVRLQGRSVVRMISSATNLILSLLSLGQSNILKYKETLKLIRKIFDINHLENVDNVDYSKEAWQWLPLNLFYRLSRQDVLKFGKRLVTLNILSYIGWVVCRQPSLLFGLSTRLGPTLSILEYIVVKFQQNIQKY